MSLIQGLANNYLYYPVEKWSLHSFLTTVLQQADVAGNILLLFLFYFLLFYFCKKIIKYYQPRQLVIELLWEMNVRIISLFSKQAVLLDFVLVCPTYHDRRPFNIVLHIYIYIYIYRTVVNTVQYSGKGASEEWLTSWQKRKERGSQTAFSIKQNRSLAMSILTQVKGDEDQNIFKLQRPMQFFSASLRLCIFTGFGSHLFHTTSLRKE